MITKVIAWLLHLANAHPSLVGRTEFYALKDRLCRRYGTHDGVDVQRIHRECYGWQFQGCEGAICRKCYGTGTFDVRWHLLERWKIGARVFHRPIGPAVPTQVFIDGRIRHDDISRRTSTEAGLWLALLFDRRCFWRMLVGGKHCGWQWRPMLALQSIVFEVRTYTRRLNCSSCGRLFFVLGTGWLYCGPCRQRLTTQLAEDDLPF